MNIFIVASKDFEKKLPNIKFSLQKLKYNVVLPTFQLGKISNFKNKKNVFFKKDFENIKKSDALLICNFKKENIENYIGASMLIYMGLAYFLDKKIFILYDIPKTHNKEEILGLDPICLQGDLKKIINYK